MALNETEKLISFCMDKRLYVHLGACYVRKGILLVNLGNENPSPWYEKGFEVLEITNNQKMIQELKKEIKFYTDM